MCKYCKEDEIILEDEVISRLSWGWGGDTKITEAEADEYKIGVFVDRGYLRLADLGDCECLDHGKKIKIKFCPFCGNTL